MRDALRQGASESWRLNRLILLFAGGYILAAEGLSRIYGFPHHLDLYHKPLVLLAALGVLVVPVHRVYRDRPERPLRFIRDGLARPSKLVHRACVIVPPVIVMALMMSSFSSVKSSLELMNPRLLDPLFLEWDRWLHGGYDVWVLLHPVLGHPWITRVVEWFYLYWLGITVGVLTYAIFITGRPVPRNQFIVAWILTWAIGGTLGAALLNSVGPCFYGLFFPEAADPYEPLLAYLADAAPMTVLSQEYLWRFHQDLGPGFGTGISAMPSMHVAIATLQAVFLWRLSRLAGILASAYAFFILVGSVHLAWHYAIDGYVSIAFVPVVWWLAGRIVSLDDGVQRSTMAPAAHHSAGTAMTAA